ncbi:MAG: DUF2971 domain-containing protein [Gemmatimonadaceae bacterium]|nr:DUF2971 domain-containing protein [Gemmatimonadaceae bacterium]
MDIFTTSALWFSSPYEYNDPFDFRIIDSGCYTTAEIEDYLLRLNTFPPAQAHAEATRLQANPPQLASLIEQAKRTVFQKKGVLCLSSLRDSILMWSHYCNKHKGVVLEFDVAQDAALFSIPLNVDYSPLYPDTRLLAQGTDAVKTCIKTKHDSWAYEKEVRIVKHKQGQVPFLKRSLTAVYFGCQATTQTLQDVTRHLVNHGFGHTKRYRAVMNPSAFQLDFELLP